MDMSWLAQEAKTLHEVFTGMFYNLILLFLLGGVVLEYFKIPLGGVPIFPQLVGRAFIAAILLVATPEIMNVLSMITDSIVAEVGKLVEIKFVLSRLSDKLGDLSWSWVSVKDTVMIMLSYLSFFLLYLTVYLMNAFFLFSWMMLYIFSPLIVAFYIFPKTATATSTLFKSLIEVCIWKILWCCLSALLWSMALSDINNPEHQINFLTVVILNLMLAFSVLMTPKITSAFLSGGISSVASGFGGAILGAAALTPVGVLAKSKALATTGVSGAKNKISSKEDKENSSNRQAQRLRGFQRSRK